MNGRTKIATLKYLGLGTAGLCLLALFPAFSSAAPLGGINEARLPSSAVTQARYQCWWADGDRHCANIKGSSGYDDDRYDDDRRYYGRRHYYDRHDYDYHPPHHGYYLPYYGYHRIYRGLKRPEAYWTGSKRWWKSMELWGRTGGNAHTP